MSDTNQTPGAPAVPTPAGSGRGVRIALAISVALNLAVAGLVAGMVLHGGPGGRGEMVRDMGFGPFEGALMPHDRDALRGALRGKLGDIRAARRQMQEDTQLILQALRADPFLPEALSEAMEAQTEHLGERLEFGSEVIRDHLLSLSDEDRRAFADRMEDRLRRGSEGSKDGDKDGEKDGD